MSSSNLHCSPAGAASAGSGNATAECPERMPQASKAFRRKREQLVDEELAQSFPASDPPSWVQGAAPEPS